MNYYRKLVFNHCTYILQMSQPVIAEQVILVIKKEEISDRQ